MTDDLRATDDPGTIDDPVTIDDLELVYDVSEWAEPRVGQLLLMLRRQQIPFSVDGNDVVVGKEYEAQADQVVATIDGEPPHDADPKGTFEH